MFGGNLGGRDGTLEGPRNRGDKALKGEKARPTRPKCAEGRDIQENPPLPPLFSTLGRGVQGVSEHSLAGGAGGRRPSCQGFGGVP